MNMITPEREAQRAQIAQDLKRFLKAGGKIKSCTIADNRNHAGMPVTPMMSQRKRSSGGKPMEITRKKKYPWHEIEVGESFFVLGRTVDHMSAQASQMRTRHGKVYSCRAEETGCTVTRVK
jgi:hypothetical protein